MRKTGETLERAYNDSLGVTRAFILNQLARINREFGADFDLWAFGLRSVYNDAEGRMDVYLESLRQQSVTIPGLDLSITLEAGERIHMENAYQYDLNSCRRWPRNRTCASNMVR